MQIVAGSASGLSSRKRSSNGSRKTERVAFTPGGQLRAASFVTVCQWVKESWQELSKETFGGTLF